MEKILSTAINQASIRKLAIVALTFLCSVSAFAKNNCDSNAALNNPASLAHSGIGGTGATQSGVGGTGFQGEGTGGTGSPESGIGGTGNTASGGIGGTGIIGTITGFASICVNGIEIHYNPNTAISVDGQLATAGELAVGQVIAARALGEGHELTARNIAVIHAAVGPVSNLNAKKGEMQVLGQTVHIGPSREQSSLSSLKTGDWVQISGHRLSNGAIAATRIEAIPPREEARLNGHVTKIDSQGFEVNGTRIHPEAKSLPAGLTQGMEVSIRGHWDGTHLKAHQLQTEPTRQSIGNVDHIVVEGYIHALDGKQLNLNNRIVTLDSNTAITGNASNDLKLDQRVQISGRPGGDQRINSEFIELKQESPVQIQIQERNLNHEIDTSGRNKKDNSDSAAEAKAAQSDKDDQNNGSGHNAGTKDELKKETNSNSGADKDHASGKNTHFGDSSRHEPEAKAAQGDKGSGHDSGTSGELKREIDNNSGKDHVPESNAHSADSSVSSKDGQHISDHSGSSGRDHVETPQDHRAQNFPDHTSIDKPEKPVELDSPERITGHNDNPRDIDIPDTARDHSMHHDRHIDR